MYKKTAFMAYFGPILPIFGQNRIFLKILFLAYQLFLILTQYPCPKFKKTNKQIPINTGFRWMNRCTHTKTDKHQA